MTLKKDPNFEEKLTFHLKNVMRNLMNFNWSGEKFKNFHFDGQLLMSELKRHRGVLS